MGDHRKMSHIKGDAAGMSEEHFESSLLKQRKIKKKKFKSNTLFFYHNAPLIAFLITCIS